VSSGRTADGVSVNLAITTVGLTMLAVTALLRRRIPRNARAALRVSFAITDGNVASEALFSKLGARRLQS
jgi:hypothetical protein